MNLRKFILMDSNPGAAGGGDGATPPGANGETPPAPGGDGGASSVLAAAAKTTEQSAPNGDWIPEKFRVMNGEVLDVEASARKLAESYAGLEKRVGSGDLPPKSADEYTITVPDALKDHWVEDDRIKAVRTEAHAKGITQGQFDFMMGKYFELAPALVQGGAQYNEQTATEELRKTWTTDEQFTANVQSAYKAFTAFADDADKGKMDEIGNNPIVLRLLARIGAEMKEGGTVPREAHGAGGEDIQTLMQSEAYWNQKHPDHKTVSAKVKGFYERKHGTQPA